MVFRRSSGLILEPSGIFRTAVSWMAAAAALWVGAFAFDRTTTIEVFSDGGKIHLEVAGTVLSAPLAQSRLTGVSIFAGDSIGPPGGRRIKISAGSETIFEERLPARFQFSNPGLTPIGDWELDEETADGTVWRHTIEHSGPYDLQASFRGRFLRDLSLVLEGEPTLSIAVRRGLINNDCFIRDSAGRVSAVTTLDPTPLSDAGAIAAAVLRAASIALLLVGIFGFIRRVSSPRPLPAAALHWHSPPLLAALIIGAAGLSGWIAIDVLEGLPHMPDSVVYLLQAGWLVDGSLWGPVSDYQEFLTIPFTYVDGERWLAHYPPGWPTVLAAGLAAGASWLVAPILGAIFLLLLYLTGRELGGDFLGLLAATLALLSPLTRLIFGSLLSHGVTATLVLAAIYLALVARRRGRWAMAASAGAAIGLAFGIRPLTAIAVALPLGIVLSLDLIHGTDDRRALRRLAGWLGGIVAAAVPTLVANTLITGAAFAFPYSLASGSMYAAANIPFGLRNLDALLASFGAGIYGWGWPVVHGQLAGAVAMAFAFVPFIYRRWRPTDALLAAIIICTLLAHLGTRGHGLHGFGPRYYFEVFAPFFLLTARGFQELGRAQNDEPNTERRKAVAVSMILFIALCLPAGAVLPQRLALYRGYNGVDGSLVRQAQDAGIHRGLIILPPDEWQGWAMAAPLLNTDAGAEVLFIQAQPDDPAILEIADGRDIYLWMSGRLVLFDSSPVDSAKSTVNSHQ